jgi:hypothetical protein
MGVRHPVPKVRSELRGGDWFAYVLGKIAPLERWSYAESSADIVEDQFPNQQDFAQALANTWQFPRFFFQYFRVDPESFKVLLRGVDAYRGGVYWSLVDDQIVPVRNDPTVYRGILVIPKGETHKMEKEFPYHPQPDIDFVNRAVADIPAFCLHLEKFLGLKDKPPVDFEEEWLTEEGLAKSRGEFEDFIDPGAWSICLLRDPTSYLTNFCETPDDSVFLSFEIGYGGIRALKGELSPTEQVREKKPQPATALPNYPLLSKFPEPWDDVAYEPADIVALLQEVARAQKVAKHPKAIRALDNLRRAANWANKRELGICFHGQ